MDAILQGIDWQKDTDLCALMNDNGSDKACNHNYTKVYSKLFSSYRGLPCNFFELGLGTTNPSLPSNMSFLRSAKPGGSLRAWKSWLGEKARIFGADIDKDILFQENLIETFWVDQMDARTIDAMWRGLPEMDVIIEDGLHEWTAQKLFLQRSWHKVKPGGLYIMEDIHPRDFERIAIWKPELEFELGAQLFLQRLPGHYPVDNNILLVEKKVS